MAERTPKPTEAELAILRTIWDGGPRGDGGPMSVREILHAIQVTKAAGYTTVLKTLQIMTEKGLVERDETVRPQIYRARNSREQTQKRLLADLLDRAFGGSVKTLVLQALSSKKSSEAEMAEIEDLLDRIEKGKDK